MWDSHPFSAFIYNFISKTVFSFFIFFIFCFYSMNMQGSNFPVLLSGLVISIDSTETQWQQGSELSQRWQPKDFWQNIARLQQIESLRNSPVTVMETFSKNLIIRKWDVRWVKRKTIKWNWFNFSFFFSQKKNLNLTLKNLTLCCASNILATVW